MHKDVELSSGQTVRVYPVPHYAVTAITERIPLPTPPTITIKPTGQPEAEWPDTNPESEAYQKYLAARKIAEQQRLKASNEFALLSALRDVQVPDDDAWYEVTDYAGLPHREGKGGRRLDYIQFVLLATMADVDLVFRTLQELSYPSEEAIQAKMKSFRGNGLDAHGESGLGNGSAGNPDEAERGTVQPSTGRIADGAEVGMGNVL